jgi:subtilisin family serine protease
MKKILVLFISLSLLLPVSRAGAVAPNDQYYSRQWYLPKIKAEAAWDKVTGSPDVVIAVIDSGIDINHPDLRDNIWHNTAENATNGIDDDNNGFIDDYSGWDFVDNTNDPSPKFSSQYTDTGLAHGTLIAGIIGASGNNRLGIAGLDWQAKIMPLRALDDKGEGRVSDVIRAIDYAVNNGADIINLSFVGSIYSQGLQEALERANKAGIIVVAASGNDQGQGNGYNLDKTLLYPACNRDAEWKNLTIAVAATDILDQKTNFSSYGNRCISLSAPGVSFFGLNPYRPGFGGGAFDTYFNGYWSGTSMATALVSGAAALIKEVNPALNSRDVIDILLRSADDINSTNPDYISRLGEGRLNVDAAVTWAKEKLLNYSGRLLIAPLSYDSRTPKDENWNKIKLTTAAGATTTSFSIGLEYRGGVNMATGDVDGDGQTEIITAPASNAEPLIKIFNSKGKLKSQFYAFAKTFKNGVNLATGDVDGDGKIEIVVAPASNFEPLVKVFDNKGKLKSQFDAYAKAFRNGVNVASGDFDADGQNEIVVGPASGGNSQVRLFDDGKLINQFYAYSKDFKGGVRLAVVNLDGRKDRNRAEIITGPGKGMTSIVKIFDDSGGLKRQFLAFTPNFIGGITLTGGDLNNDGLNELAVAAGPGGAPHVRVFSGQGELLQSFYTFKESYAGGVSLSFIYIPN